MRPALVLLIIVTAGCSVGNWYEPDFKRQPQEIHGEQRRGSFVNMNDRDAAAYLVRDISGTLEAGTWRWAGPRAALRFQVPAAAGLRFKMDYGVPEQAFAQTGALAIEIRLNNQLLATARVEQPGPQQFLQAVPAGLLQPNSEVLVTFTTSKLFRPSPNESYAFILTRAGFTE